MRASVDPHDPAYREDGHSLAVFLDGAPVRCCVTADEEQGFVVCHAQREDGACAHVAGEWTLETRRGRVEIMEAERRAA